MESCVPSGGMGAASVAASSTDAISDLLSSASSSAGPFCISAFGSSLINLQRC